MAPGELRGVATVAVAAASWSNVALLETWQGLFDPTTVSAAGGWITPEAYWAAALAILVTAAAGGLTALALRGAPRIKLLVGDTVLLAALCSLSLTLWRVSGGQLTTLNAASVLRGPQGVAAALAAVLAGALVLRHWRGCMRMGRGLLLVVSPFILVTFIRAGFMLSRTDFAELNRMVPTRGLAEPRPGPRVVIIIFDELDYTFAFADRPPGLELPAFDELRSASVSATNVAPPGRMTHLSLPSYILGQPVMAVVSREPHSEIVRYGNRSAPVDMSGQTTIFHDAARLGAGSELVGSFLPYCRWGFAALLQRCTWRPFTWGGTFDGPVGIVAALERQLMALTFLGNRTAHIARIEELSAVSERAVADSSRRLVFLHLPIPHLPPIWDARHNRYTITQTSTSAYFGNLVLADRILARLSAAITQGRTAQPTFVIVTSDHPWRYGPIKGRSGGGIPFFVRTPSEVHIDVPDRFEAVRLRMLVASLLGGRLTTSKDVAAWLASSRSNH